MARGLLPRPGAGGGDTQQRAALARRRGLAEERPGVLVPAPGEPCAGELETHRRGVGSESQGLGEVLVGPGRVAVRQEHAAEERLHLGRGRRPCRGPTERCYGLARPAPGVEEIDEPLERVDAGRVERQGRAQLTLGLLRTAFRPGQDRPCERRIRPRLRRRAKAGQDPPCHRWRACARRELHRLDEHVAPSVERERPRIEIERGLRTILGTDRLGEPEQRRHVGGLLGNDRAQLAFGAGIVAAPVEDLAEVQASEGRGARPHVAERHEPLTQRGVRRVGGSPGGARVDASLGLEGADPGHRPGGRLGRQQRVRHPARHLEAHREPRRVEDRGREVERRHGTCVAWRGGGAVPARVPASIAATMP